MDGRATARVPEGYEEAEVEPEDEDMQQEVADPRHEKRKAEESVQLSAEGRPAEDPQQTLPLT